MTPTEMKKAAEAFVQGKNPKNALGCYITKDGSVFYRDYEGLQFARSAAGNPKEVFEFDANADLIVPVDLEKERAALITLISKDPANKYGAAQLENFGNEGLRKLASDLRKSNELTGEFVDTDAEDDGEVNLDKMKKPELIALLADLDPTLNVTKETSAQLKDLIVSANTLTDYSDAQLIGMVKAFSPEMIADGMSDEDVTKVMSTDDLKAIVLNLRDDVEMSQEINDKLFAIGEGE